MKFGAGAGEDSFGKRLQKEASAETSHKAPWDEAQVLPEAHSVKPFCEGVRTAGCQVKAEESTNLKKAARELVDP